MPRGGFIPETGFGLAGIFPAEGRRRREAAVQKINMTQLAVIDQEDFDPMQATEEVTPWELKTLKPKHLQICALLAQGFKNIEVAGMVGVTKEYVSMLLRQPLIKQEIAKRGEVLSARFELMTEMTADAMVDTLKNGSHGDKMKAARLQLEVTKRIGRPDPFANSANVPDDRLEKLASRLEHLLDNTKGGLYDESGSPIYEDAEVLREWPHSGGSASAE